jgi:hypothetical protein
LRFSRVHLLLIPEIPRYYDRGGYWKKQFR